MKWYSIEMALDRHACLEILTANKLNKEFVARYHGVGGLLTTNRFPHQPEMAKDILQAARELGYPVSDDLNGVQFSGFAVAQSNTR